MSKKESQKVRKSKKKQKPAPKPQFLLNPIHNKVMDYHVYVMSPAEKLLYSLIAFVVGGIVSQMFYGGLFMKDGVPTTLTNISNVAVFVIVGLVAGKIFLPIRTAQLLEKRQKELRKQFRDMLESITASLSANDTVVQAFHYAYRDMQMQYSDNAYITKELKQITEALKNNVDLELMVEDFAKRSACEDIEDFSNVFKVSYGPGGRMKDVMRQTHSVICEKMQIEDEIASKISANKLELNIITCAPILIVAMLKMSSADFAANFATPVGVVVNTLAIVLFVVAYRMGQKIVDIKG